MFFSGLQCFSTIHYPIVVFIAIKPKIFICYSRMKRIRTIARGMNIGITIFVTTKMTVIEMCEIGNTLAISRLIGDFIHI